MLNLENSLNLTKKLITTFQIPQNLLKLSVNLDQKLTKELKFYKSV